MTNLEDVLRPTQKGLLKMLRKQFKNETTVYKANKYFLVIGDAPVMLLAHLDTVHQQPVQTICKSSDGSIWMSPQGIGGDDRCGVYVLLQAYKKAAQKPWLLFTCDEEIGCIGADEFSYDACDPKKKWTPRLNDLKLLVQVDRKGDRDAVYYDCANKDLETYIKSKGFKTAYGSCSDISLIAPELGVAAVNLSSGYYNPHTQHEFINTKHLERTLNKVLEIVKDSPSLDRFEYIAAVKDVARLRQASVYRVPDGWWKNDYKEPPVSTWLSGKDEPKSKYELDDFYLEMYDELLDYYAYDELEEILDTEGKEGLLALYESEFGPLDWGK